MLKSMAMQHNAVNKKICFNLRIRSFAGPGRYRGKAGKTNAWPQTVRCNCMKNIIFIYLVIILSCGFRVTNNSSGLNSPGKNRRIAHELVTDIKKDFHINFLNATAAPLELKSYEKTLLINSCKEFISEVDIKKMSDAGSQSFIWDPHRLKDIRITTHDSAVASAYRTRTQEYYHFISAPILDKNGEYAIVRISRISADMVFESSTCDYLFRRLKLKWTEMAKANCDSYSDIRECTPR
jgi:hypothetical protein